jgi:hypothetical protein
VLEESAARLVLWLPPGIVGKRPDGDLFEGWTLRDRVLRRRNGIVRVTEPGDGYSLLHFWDDDGSFAGWYVNLEGPLVRTALGWDFEDHLLDLWLPAGGEPEWLDEHELARAVELGLRTEGDAAAARAAGERALGRLLARGGTVRTGWEEWRPEARPPLPQLPPGWDVVP